MTPLKGGHFATAPLVCAPCQRRDSRALADRCSPRRVELGRRARDMAGYVWGGGQAGWQCSLAPEIW